MIVMYAMLIIHATISGILNLFQFFPMYNILLPSNIAVN